MVQISWAKVTPFDVSGAPVWADVYLGLYIHTPAQNTKSLCNCRPCKAATHLCRATSTQQTGWAGWGSSLQGRREWTRCLLGLAYCHPSHSYTTKGWRLALLGSILAAPAPRSPLGCPTPLDRSQGRSCCPSQPGECSISQEISDPGSCPNSHT